MEISHKFEECFDRSVEDYSLTVTSAGLDQPFKVQKQYQKAVGTQVEAALKGGRKFVAELVGADEDAVTLKYTLRGHSQRIVLCGALRQVRVCRAELCPSAH